MMEWQDLAACRQVPWDNLTADDQIAVCTTCPVLQECKTYGDHVEGQRRPHDLADEVLAGETARDRVTRRLETVRGPYACPKCESNDYFLDKNLTRVCLACQRQRNRAWKQKQRAAA